MNTIGIEPGEYKVVLAHIEDRRSKVGTQYRTVTAVVIEGERAGTVLWGIYPDAPAAAWKWNEAVDDLQDLTVGNKFNAQVRIDIDRDGATCTELGRLTQLVEPPRTIRRYGAEYRFVRRLPEEETT